MQGETEPGEKCWEEIQEDEESVPTILIDESSFKN